VPTRLVNMRPFCNILTAVVAGVDAKRGNLFDSLGRYQFSGVYRARAEFAVSALTGWRTGKSVGQQSRTLQPRLDHKLFTGIAIRQLARPASSISTPRWRELAGLSQSDAAQKSQSARSRAIVRYSGQCLCGASREDTARCRELQDYFRLFKNDHCNSSRGPASNTPNAGYIVLGCSSNGFQARILRVRAAPHLEPAGMDRNGKLAVESLAANTALGIRGRSSAPPDAQSTQTRFLPGREARRWWLFEAHDLLRLLNALREHKVANGPRRAWWDRGRRPGTQGRVKVVSRAAMM